MGLTSLSFLLLVGLLAAVVVGGTAWSWNRWPRRAAWPLRIGGLLLIMVFGALLAGDQENRTYVFYASFGELFGGAAPATRTVSAVDGRLAQSVILRGQQAASRGRGVILPVRLPGGRSGVTRDGLVYLPAAYFAHGSTLRFPVVELFHGTPGTPVGWAGPMHLASVLDREIAAGRVQPMIAVIPAYNDGARDRECLNAVRGEQDETYLAVDVPADVGRDFRALETPGSWATMGFSTGGYCAVDVALHHAGRYAAAASLSGYFTAVADRSGVLFHGSRTVRAVDSPTWYVRHHAGPTPALYLMGSKGDPDTVAEIRALTLALGRTRPPTSVVLASGGHNFTVWSAVSGPAFDWVAAHLPSPLAPALSAEGVRPPAPPVPLSQRKQARGRELARGADREKRLPRRVV